MPSKVVEILAKHGTIVLEKEAEIGLPFENANPRNHL